jgi:putative membrane protein
MTMYIMGLIVLKLLYTAVFLLGLYKVISLMHGKMQKHHTNGESRGTIILKERFASGEIDEDKYRLMSKVLKD